jgi:hypothetical protein
MHSDKRVCFFVGVDLMNLLESEKQQSTAGNMARQDVRSDAVILHELGYLAFPAPGGTVLFHLIRPFMKRPRSFKRQPGISSMPTNHFKAISRYGDLLFTELIAESVEGVIHSVQDGGLLLVDIRGAGRLLDRKSIIYRCNRHPGPAANFSMVLRKIGRFLLDGIPRSRTLDVLSRLAPGRSTAAALDVVGRHVREGLSLSDAIRKAGLRLPQIASTMTEVGGGTATLTTMLANAADYMNRSKRNGGRSKPP